MGYFNSVRGLVCMWTMSEFEPCSLRHALPSVCSDVTSWQPIHPPGFLNMWTAVRGSSLHCNLLYIVCVNLGVQNTAGEQKTMGWNSNRRRATFKTCRPNKIFNKVIRQLCTQLCSWLWTGIYSIRRKNNKCRILNWTVKWLNIMRE